MCWCKLFLHWSANTPLQFIWLSCIVQVCKVHGGSEDDHGWLTGAIRAEKRQEPWKKRAGKSSKARLCLRTRTSPLRTRPCSATAPHPLPGCREKSPGYAHRLDPVPSAKGKCLFTCFIDDVIVWLYFITCGTVQPKYNFPCCLDDCWNIPTCPIISVLTITFSTWGGSDKTQPFYMMVTKMTESLWI